MSIRPEPRFRCLEVPGLGPGIGLALGGGFARGFAHLGVLRVLEQEQIPIACIAGSSIGGIFGAAYAGGLPIGSMISACRQIRFRDFTGWSSSRFGLGSNKRLAALIERCFDSRQFEDLAIPVAIVATDLDSGAPVLFQQGPLSEAIRASCAFPGLFEPVQFGTRHLADGSLVAPVPARAARELGAQIVVGVSLSLHDGETGAPSNIFQVACRAISAAQKAQMESLESQADFALYPSVDSMAWNAVERIDEAMHAGAFAARNALPQIRKFLTLRSELAFQIQRQAQLGIHGVMQ